MALKAADSVRTGAGATDSGAGNKLSVLVTRPAGQGASLCSALETAGYTVHAQPLLELHALPELSPLQRQLVLGLDLYQHVIFISGNAVRFGMDCIEGYWPQLPVGLTWYAIGDSTARLLLDRGIVAVTPGATMTSEGLLAVPQLQAVADQRVLIIKGEGGRATLQKELERRGAQVDQLACYRRSCPELPAGELAAKIALWRVDVVMISSGEGLANMEGLLRPAETTKFRHIGLIVPSERVARQAREAGFEQVVTAGNASDAAMFDALEEWQPSSGE
ncbi:MAG: uroporphyrinogen-III synthase [Halioglobus sp.]